MGTSRGLFEVPLPAREGQGLERFVPAPVDQQISLSDSEPSIRQVQEAAVRYAEVMPEKIQRWRTGAALRTWLPKFTLGLNQDTDTTVASATSAGKTTFSVGPEDRSVGVNFGFTWDLANFIWNQIGRASCRERV